MHSVFDRLKTALADRYAIEREIGAGGKKSLGKSSGQVLRGNR